jgi:hypothetical protein
MDTTIYGHIFYGEIVTEEYVEACDKLLQALKAHGQIEESQLYEEAGFLFDKTPKKQWGQHLINISYRIDRKNKKEGRFQ